MDHLASNIAHIHRIFGHSELDEPIAGAHAWNQRELIDASLPPAGGCRAACKPTGVSTVKYDPLRAGDRYADQRMIHCHFEGSFHIDLEQTIVPYWNGIQYTVLH